MHTLYGGEVVANAASGTPLNTTEYISKEGFRTHTSYLNIEWNNKVIDSWRNEKYNGEDTLYKGQTGFTYISNHLGYRFVIRKSEIQENVKQNEALKINLDIENVGFANLVNNKVVSLVLMKDDEVYEIKTNVDATKWNSREISHINLEQELPKNITPGEWKVYLRISEYGDMKTDNNYKAIRLANSGDMWNKTIGANYIGKFIASRESNTIVAFADANMYNKICEELKDKIIKKDDNEKSIVVKDIETVTKLELNNSKISNLKGIENFTELKELNISNNGIVSISSLSHLTSLKSLSAYGNAITNLSPISNLNNLTYLNVSKNKLQDSAGNSQNSVTKSISTLTNLTELDMSHNYLRYVNGLNTLTNLTSLNLYDNAIRDLTELEALTNLTKLNLGENNENGADNGVVGLESLENLINLEELDFSENKTPNVVNHITNLTKLKKLSLQRNDIRNEANSSKPGNVEKLGSLTNLEVLNLYYNAIETIPQEFSNLTNLKELIMGNNWLYDITGFYKDNTIKFKNLRKLDLSKNEAIETLSQNEINQSWTKRVENNLNIMKLLQKDIDELNDENITDTSNLPHYDENGVAYVTYEDFGARCNGVYDDFIAIRNAHIFANKNGYEVRATEGKTYHIFKYYEEAVTVKTNVDWKNANFIIHDEEIEKLSGRYQSIFRFTNITDIVTIDNPNWTIGKNTKTIPEIVDTLNTLNEKEYKSYLCAAVNTNKKQYIRYGSDGNSGDNQQDYFIVDSNGKVLNDIQWDFEKITTFTIYPISNTSLNIKNGNFISNSINSKSETPYTRSNSGKPIYFARNIYIEKAANVNISGINHKLSYELDKDEMSGSYMGFIKTNIVANFKMSDCSLFTRKYNVDGRSTYDLTLSATVNVICKNITSNNITDLDRWGIMGTLFTKDVLFENCKLNRIDAHQGIYNLTVKNCNIGSRGLTMTGQGTLNVIGTTIESDTFISLRGDYGSTWDGNVNIIDCTYKYNGIWMPKLFNVFLYYDGNQLHDFGYDCKMPNINVHNFTIDMNQNEKYNKFYIMSFNGIKLKDKYLENTKNYLEKYLPTNINVNQYKFINTQADIKLEMANTNGSGNLETYLKDYSYVISNAVLKEKDNDKNLLSKIDFEDNFISNKLLNFEISKNSLTKNNVSIYKDGKLVIENQPVDDKYTYTFDKDGTYKIEISSLDEKNQYKGIKTYEFTLELEKTDDETIQSKLKATKLGIGGGGALFEPAISPFDSNEMLVVPDMGGIYISHNTGESWNRVNLYGTVISATYDPNRKGVIYAGGSGLYRSTDYGNTFELIFPRKDDIITRLTHNENGLQYYFTKSGIYDRNKYVKNILIDPEDSNHIFILCYSYRNGKVFESTDNGENFKEIFTYTKSAYRSVQFDFNELLYKKETKDLFVINEEKIIRYNLNTKTQDIAYESELGLVDVTTVYENNKTYFIIIEKTDKLDNSDTMVYYTNNFVDKVDITDELTSVQPTTFHNNTYGDVTYKYDFHYISATSLNNIYITNWSYQKTSSIKEYPYTIDGIIRYHNGEATYLYGNPFKDHNNLSSRAWCDGNTHSLGISASKQKEDEFIFTTLCGVYYSPDNTHIYPKYSTVTEGKYPNAKYVTNGIDEQGTYGVYENPFNRNELLLLNTDLGLIRSEDNGKSWERAIAGIPNNWVNTVYDVAFDERRENYVYSLWSGRHNAPYSAGNETDGRYGGFAISKDGGKTWDASYSSGLPQNTIPVKMSVVYPEDSEEVTIYVATFNEGFFVSYDSGKTFTEMNEGLNKITYKEEEKYKYIFASDIEVKEGHIFGITAKTSYNNETQPGELFEYVNGKWQKIDLPKNVKTPRDIYYHNGILYISGVATAVWEYKNGIDFTNYGGGVYAYEHGKFTQIFDESISTTSVQIDSKGTIYISDINGHIYRKERDKEYQKIYDNYFYISKGLQISYNDDYLYLASFGGGLLKLENLNSLYEHKCSGGVATCTKKAICKTCGKEYGELDKNNHTSTTTHKINEKKSTCYEEGYTGDIVYDCCQAVMEEGTVVGKIQHQYDDGIITKEATYETEGEKTYTCKICNETKIEVIPKLENEDKNDEEDTNKNDEENTNKNDEEDTNKNDEENTNKNDEEVDNGNNQNSSNKQDNTVSEESLPQTGKSFKIEFWIIITALIVFAVYCRIKIISKQD